MRKCLLLRKIDVPASPASDAFRALESALRTAGWESTIETLDTPRLDATKLGDMIRAVSEVDLLIVDVVGLHPVMFHLAGIRRAYGWPVFYLQKSELDFEIELPSKTFSVPATNDYATVSAFAEAVSAAAGTVRRPPVASATSVSTSLLRLEELIRGLSTRAETALRPDSARANDQDDSGPFRTSDILKSPQQLFMEAIAIQDFSRAAVTLGPLRRTIGLSSELLRAAVMCVAAHQESAVPYVEEFLNPLATSITTEDFTLAAGVLVNFYARRNQEAKALRLLEPVIDQWIKDNDLQDKEKASLLVQKQRLLFGLKQFNEAAALLDEILLLDPNKPSYLHNASMVYEAMNNFDEALKYTVMLDNLGPSSDPDHISQMIDIYALHNLVDRVNELMLELERIDPARYKLKKMMMRQHDST